MNVHAREPAPSSVHRFDGIVCLKFKSGWYYVDSAERALECLGDKFDNPYEPSWQRAHATCKAFVAGQVDNTAAKSAFIVAAMAAGIAYELADSYSVIERHVEEAAKDGLLNIIFDDETP